MAMAGVTVLGLMAGLLRLPISRYKGFGIPCHPLAAGGFGGTEVVGAWCRKYTTLGTAPREGAWVD